MGKGGRALRLRFWVETSVGTCIQAGVGDTWLPRPEAFPLSIPKTYCFGDRSPKSASAPVPDVALEKLLPWGRPGLQNVAFRSERPVVLAF